MLCRLLFLLLYDVVVVFITVLDWKWCPPGLVPEGPALEIRETPSIVVAVLLLI